MVVGVALTIAFQNIATEPSLLTALAVFILFLSLLGLMLTNRWGKTFDTHMERAARAAQKLGLTEYVVLPGQYSGLSRLRRTRFLFCYYYSAVIGLTSGTILYNTFIPDITIGVASGVLAFVIASVSILVDPVKSLDPNPLSHSNPHIT